jgi:branched-chain amino acid transport system permease protein
VLLLADGTPAEPAFEDPGRFAITVLDGVTFAGLLFVVASGFT